MQTHARLSQMQKGTNKPMCHERAKTTCCVQHAPYHTIHTLKNERSLCTLFFLSSVP